MAGPGRPGPNKTQIDLKEVERLAGLGLTQQEIADCIGLHLNTIVSRKRESVELCDAIRRGKSRTNSFVANKLYSLCEQGNLGAIVWYEKTRSGRSDKVITESTNDNKITIEYVSKTNEPDDT